MSAVEANGMVEPSRFQNRYLRTHDAGLYLGLSGRTLEKHRSCGTGPRYKKIGGRVIYAVSDLEAWADQGARMTTDSDAGYVAPVRRREAESVASRA